jgi:carboxyl-terminal processing protease
VPSRNLTILILTAVASLICFGEANRNRYASILSESIAKISDYYVEPVDSRTLFEGGMNGMLNQLDPYSGYIPPEEYSLFRVDIEQEFGGIGIEVRLMNDQLTVLSPVPGSPAFEKGLVAGDVILAIDGQSTEGYTLEDAVERMRGPIGSEVRVKIQHRDTTTPIDLTLTRARIRVESIRGDSRGADGQWKFVLADHPRIGYIRLTSFGDHTAEDLQRVLESLNGSIDGLILDLRGNAGGLLTAAVDVCDMFIPDGKLIVSTRGRDPAQYRNYEATKPAIVDANLPMVVLVDRFSASASEIVAACLQDYGRGAIVGERTWGKGTVQNVLELEGGRSAIRLTTQTYWRPSGKNIHRHRNASEDEEWGVQPAPENLVPLTVEQYRQLAEQRGLRDYPETAKALRSEETEGTEESDEAAEAIVDPQLQRAIEVLRAKVTSRPLSPPV